MVICSQSIINMKTIIEIATNRVIGATYSNECLETQTLIDELLQVVMVKPFFDFETSVAE